MTRDTITPFLLDATTRAIAIDWPVISSDLGLGFNVSNPFAPTVPGGPALYNIIINVAIAIGSTFSDEQLNLNLYANGEFIARDIVYTPINPPKTMLLKIGVFFARADPTMTFEVQLTYPFDSNFVSGFIYVADSFFSVEKTILTE